jgi:signal transduction histidine kinase
MLEAKVQTTRHAGLDDEAISSFRRRVADLDQPSGIRAKVDDEARTHAALKLLHLAEDEVLTMQEELESTHEALDAERKTYAELFDLAPDPQFVTDRVGVIHLANRATVALLGTNRNDLRGRPFVSFLEAPGVASFRAALERAAFGASEASLSLVLPTETVRLALHAVRIGVHRVLWTGRTLHSARLAEASETEPERPSGERTLRDISRHLQLSLLSILESTHALRASQSHTDGGSPGSGVNLLESIDHHVLRQAAFIDGLVDVIRIMGHSFALERRQVDVGKIVCDAVEAVRSVTDERNVGLTRSIPERLFVLGDEVRLMQVAMNLLSNAIRHTPPGGSIHVGATLDATGVRITVSDSGRGIRAHMLGPIFECFARGPEEDAEPSLGVGLFLVKQIVELHGGEISASSDGEGRGARFVVTLPSPPAIASARPARPALARARR